MFNLSMAAYQQWLSSQEAVGLRIRIFIVGLIQDEL